MSFNAEEKKLASDAIIVRKSGSTGITTLELNLEWALCKRRLEAFTESVLTRFSQSLPRVKGYVLLLGRGNERRNEDAMKYWRVGRYQDQLNEESADVRAIADEAFKRLALRIFEESGLWQIME